MNTVIFGKGVMGQAVGSLLEYNRVEFEYVDVGQILTHTPKVVFIAVPVQHIREALSTSKSFLSDKTVFINCAKGIENTTLFLPHEIVDELFSPQQYGALVGPSFAAEIVAKQPTGVSLGLKHDDMREIRAMLETPFFFIEETDSYQAIELAAALKNVYAIAAGFAYGIGWQMNTRALLMTRALDEIAHALAGCGYAYSSLAIPGIVGDLILTCSSEESRNFRYGEDLARAFTAEDLGRINGTVEGYHTSVSLKEWSHAHNIPLPLAAFVQEIIKKGRSSEKDFISFLGSMS